MLLIFFFFFFVITAAAREEELIFDEDFATLDASRWHHEITLGGDGNREFQAYVDDRNVSYVANGILHIQPRATVDFVDDIGSGTMDLRPMGCVEGCVRAATPENVLPPVLSAKLTTKASFAFTYGRLEVRGKLPRGKWLWPAIWLMPRDNYYGEWPRSGEIDVAESRGNFATSYRGIGNDAVSSTLHWGPAWNKNAWSLTTNSTILSKNLTFSDDFHVFGLQWSRKELFTYVDSPENVLTRLKMTANKYDLGRENGFWSSDDPNPWPHRRAPFDKPFYVILNVAVGGTSLGAPGSLFETGYFPDALDGKPWSSFEAFPHTSFYDDMADWLPTWTTPLQIDSVKIWRVKNCTHHTRIRLYLLGGTLIAASCALLVLGRSWFVGRRKIGIFPYDPAEVNPLFKTKPLPPVKSRL